MGFLTLPEKTHFPPGISGQSFSIENLPKIPGYFRLGPSTGFRDRKCLDLIAPRASRTETHIHSHTHTANKPGSRCVPQRCGVVYGSTAVVQQNTTSESEFHLPKYVDRPVNRRRPYHHKTKKKLYENPAVDKRSD